LVINILEKIVEYFCAKDFTFGQLFLIVNQLFSTAIKKYTHHVNVTMLVVA